MISVILSLITFLIILTIIITIHEFGHFYTAKKFGVYCREFSIGMGNKLFSKKKGETIYAIRAIPMGGFVQMVGEDGEAFELIEGEPIWFHLNQDEKIDMLAQNGDEMIDGTWNKGILVSAERHQQPMQFKLLIDEQEKILETTALVTYYDANQQENWLVAKIRQFTYLKPWKKIIVLTAGVFLNFVTAFVFILISSTLSGVYVQPVIQEDQFAQMNGNEAFQVNDKILMIDKQKMNTIKDLQKFVQDNPNKTVTVTVLRENKEVPLKRILSESSQAYDVLTTNGVVSKKVGLIDVSFKKSYHIVDVFRGSVTKYLAIFQQIFLTLKLLLWGKIKIAQLSGFVGIAQATNTVIKDSLVQDHSISGLLQSSKTVIANLLSFTAFLSINIGVMNILPFPALDGGRVIFALYEWITKKRAHAKFEYYFNATGFIMLILLFIFITFFDIGRLIGL